jgi:hypothetical protein
MHIITFSDFIQVLDIKRRHPTKNDYFSMHILFTRIYLLQEHKLNHRNYSKQKINMSNFVLATENDVHMYAKIQCENIHRFL